jgi:hypothetical protein
MIQPGAERSACFGNRFQLRVDVAIKIEPFAHRVETAKVVVFVEVIYTRRERLSRFWGKFAQFINCEASGCFAHRSKSSGILNARDRDNDRSLIKFGPIGFQLFDVRKADWMAFRWFARQPRLLRRLPCISRD